MRRWYPGTWLVIVLVSLQTGVHLVNELTYSSPRWDVNAEGTVFSYGSAAVVGLAALGCLVAPAPSRLRRQLRLAAPFLAFLALDEAFSIHERVAFRATRLLGLSDSWDSIVWPVVYIPLLAAVALVLLRAALTAPEVTRRRLLVGLALLGTAVLLEIVSAPFSTPSTADGLVHAVEGGVEEACELGGWATLALGLLRWSRRSSEAEVATDQR